MTLSFFGISLMNYCRNLCQKLQFDIFHQTVIMRNRTYCFIVSIFGRGLDKLLMNYYILYLYFLIQIHLYAAYSVHFSTKPYFCLSMITALQAERLRIRFPMKSLRIFIYLILPDALWPWGRLNP